MAPPVFLPRNLRATQTPTVQAAAYSAGNLVGGLLTFSDMSRGDGGGVIQTVTVRDKAGQAGTYDLFIFNANPTATTFTDKSAVAINTADLAKVVGVITLAAVKLGAASTMGVTTSTNVNMAYTIPSGSTLYGALVARGTPTYASTSDVSIDLIVQPD